MVDPEITAALAFAKSLAFGTGPNDAGAEEAAFGALYGAFGLAAPAVVRAASPRAAILAADERSDATVAVPRIPDLYERLDMAFVDQVEDGLCERTRDAFLDSAAAARINAAWHVIAAGVYAGRPVRRRPEVAVTAQYGQQSAIRVALYSFVRRLGVRFEPTNSAALDALAVLTRSGWWWGFETVVVVSARPRTFTPAIEFPDGLLAGRIPVTD